MASTRLIKPYFKAQRSVIFLGVLCLVAVDGLQVLIPQVVKGAIDDLTGYRIDTTGLLVYSAEIIGIAILIGCFRYIWRRCLIGTSRVVEEGLRNRLFFHIQTLSADYFDRTKTGDIMAHASNDIQHVRMATGMGVVALTDGIVLGTAAVGFMAYINLRLTLFVLIPMPLIIFGARLLSRKMHHLYQRVQASFSDMTEIVRERLAGIRIIKAYTGERDAISALEETSSAYVGENLRLVRVTGFFFPMMLLFSNLSLVIVLFLGGHQTLNFTITPGDFVAFISYIGLLTWPMMAMGWVTNLIQRGKASLDRIDAILGVEPTIADRPDALPMPTTRGAIRFDRVAFGYENSLTPALLDIEIDIKSGSVVGLVGPPGSGKTSLINLIPRLYDASDGRILLDDVDLRHIRLTDLRKHVSVVPQEPFLFSGTIRDNILAGARFGESHLIRAVEEAALTDTIAEFPDGFDTVVGERGIILSGGQKQRIALARALLRDSAVLLLDDPISQVDTETGNRIIESIRQQARHRTVIIVSHRTAAVRFADTIHLFERGRISASGSHDQLMGYDNFYRRTFRLQEVEEAFGPEQP